MTSAGSLGCPNCGAAADPDARACAFCQARLATVACPHCFGMVFVGSRHCAHCGARARAPRALDGSPWRCPRGHGDLQGIALGGAEIGECPACAGLWLDEETFQHVVADRTRDAVVPQGGAAAAAPKVVEGDRVRYVPCPDCGKIMNRTNFARTSGIVLDACKGHGVWCDADELRRVVEFVQAGGMDVARRRELEAIRAERQRAALVQQGGPGLAFHEPKPAEIRSPILGAGVKLLFSLLRG